MKRIRTIIFYLAITLVLTFAAGMANADVPVKIFESSHKDSIHLDSAKITQIVTEEFQLDAEDTPFREANVKVLYESNGGPDYLIVHLKDKLRWTFETARVELEDGYTVSDVEMDYTPSEEDMSQDVAATAAACPDNSVQMVFATCETGIPTAVAGIRSAARTAQAAGYRVRTLYGSAESVQAYRNWLSCNNLILLGRIGHGSPNGINVSNGTVYYSAFGQAGGKVLYFNSCQVHNNPLKRSIMNAGARRFIGGICNLWIGSSEEVFKCWMNRVLNYKYGMTPSVSACEQSTGYPDPGCHGISGWSGSDYIY